VIEIIGENFAPGPEVTASGRQKRICPNIQKGHPINNFGVLRNSFYLSGMEIDMTTPALLFPAVSLLLLAFTNRFLALAALIRELHARYKEAPSRIILDQITNLRKRIHLIRDMQALGVASLFLCVVCMFLLFAGHMAAGKILFGISLLLLMSSLVLSIIEIRISVKALEIHLSDIEHKA